MQTASTRSSPEGVASLGDVDRAARTADHSVVAIIPAYNEAGSIADVIRGARPHVDVVVVIDDASDDDTADIARELADSVISHPTNLGVGAALDTGYRLAIREGFDLIVQLDADGQHDPSLIPDLLAAKDETSADMIVGSRWLNASHKEFSLVRRLGNNVFTLEANLLGDLDVTDVTSGYRVYDAAMIEDLERSARNHWALEQTLEAARRGYAIEEVSVPMPPNGDSSQFDLATFALYPARMVAATLKVFLRR